MRKTAVILSLALALGMLLPGVPARAENDTYIQKNTSSETGYIVKLKEPGEDEASLMALSELDEIYSGAKLYHADSLENIELLGGAVEYYEPDCEAELFALTNDPYSNTQWSLEFLGMDKAWNRGYYGRGVRVAVIDSGVFSMHEDFSGTDFDSGVNVINGSHDVSDTNGHGTAVCGILAATSNNGLGVAGLCDKVTVVPIKCFDESKKTKASYVVSALYEAVDVYDCDVINMSLGISNDLQSVREAVDYASSGGAIVVASVGNDGNSLIRYPAAYDNVIGVGAVNSGGEVSDFSNKNSSVFVTAPGENISVLSIRDSRSYASSGGTSDSAPMVSAAAAALKQLCPSADVEDFKNLLKASCTDAGDPGYDNSYGYGILNLDAFTRELAGYVFTDVDNHWAEDSVGLCVGRGYFNGMSERSFAPDQLMNRAMFITLISRLSGEDISGGTVRFSDVPPDSYYAQACAWGADRDIVQGYDGKFMPENNVTREQMATFLYRFAKYSYLTYGVSSTAVLDSYTDSRSISPYAREAMAWAVEEGLITGRTPVQLSPLENAARAEVAALIERFAVKYNLD